MELFLRIAIALIFGTAVGAVTYRLFTMRKQKVLKAVPDESRSDILKKYSKYEKDEVTDWHTTQIVLNKAVPDILMKYNYQDYCSRSSDNKDGIVFAMLDFVCDNFRHYSNAHINGDHGIVGVIKNCEKSDMKTNCRGLSLILSEVLRMNGIKARHITCKPYEEPFSDCHVVVDCLMPSGKRIMLDPTYRLYFTDDNGKYVSIEKLREGIIAGKSFCPNKTASYNGSPFDYHGYIEYMAKNLLRLNTNYVLNDTDSIRSQIELIPSGYSVEGYPKFVQYTTNPDYFWDMG